MASRSGVRTLWRGLHTTRITRGSGPAWGTEVNEPGGRLFGEKVLKPGERRVPFDWELPYIGTLAASVVIVCVGLSSRPNTDISVWAREEALERMARREMSGEAAADAE